MNEYTRIVIEEYCVTHNTQKSARLFRLVQMSYDLSAEGSDACYLEGIISREGNPELKQALQDLDGYLFGW